MYANQTKSNPARHEGAGPIARTRAEIPARQHSADGAAKPSAFKWEPDTSVVMLGPSESLYLAPPSAAPSQPRDILNGPRTFGELRRALESAAPNGVITLTQDITEPPIFFWQSVTVNNGVVIKGNGYSIGVRGDPARQLSAPLIGGGQAVGLTVENLTLCVNIPNTGVIGPVGALAESVHDATFRDVVVTGVCRQRSSGIGGLVGEASGSTGFFSCVSEVELTCLSEVGGIVGRAFGSPLFDKCINKGILRLLAEPGAGDSNVGGIVGVVDNGTLSGCVNTARIACKSRRVGGIAGDARAALFENCENRGSLEGSTGQVGGVVGVASDGTSLRGCANSGAVSPASDGEPSDAAGIAGTLYSDCRAERCSNIAAVNGADLPVNKKLAYAGGIAGRMSCGCQVTGCTNSGIVRGDSMLGGIAGAAECGESALISRNANRGSVISAAAYGSRLGGIVGWACGAASITDNISGGEGCEVVGGSDIGGIVGMAGGLHHETRDAEGTTLVQNNVVLPIRLTADACTNTDGVHRVIGRYEPSQSCALLLADNLADPSARLTGSNRSLTGVDYDTAAAKPGLLYKKSGVDLSDPDYGANRMHGADRTVRAAGQYMQAPIGRMYPIRSPKNID